jgi:transketolase
MSSVEMPAAEVLRRVSARIRVRLVELSHRARVPHLGSSLSCVEILVAAYWGALAIDPAAPDDPARDRFILGKGHAATTLYTTLAMRGFFAESLLETFAEPGSRLAEHPIPRCVPGVELATGSLGHGLPVGVGLALSARLHGRGNRVVVCISDGECNEGTVWEAALLAAAQRLDHLAVIIDYNKWQATGRSDEVLALAPLRDKWAAFGWSAIEVDGHDVGAVMRCLMGVPDGSGRPVAIVAHTVKGKGVSFMEDDNNWHYRIPSAEELAAARAELGPT